MLQAGHVLVIRDHELVEAIIVHSTWGHLGLILVQAARVGHAGGRHWVLRVLWRALHDAGWDHTDTRDLLSAGRRVDRLGESATSAALRLAFDLWLPRRVWWHVLVR